MGAPLLYFYLKWNIVPLVYDNYLVYLELTGSALSNFLGQLCFVTACQNANPSRVALYMYIGLGYSFFGDHFFFTLNLTWLQGSGVAICVVSCISALIFKIQDNKENSPFDKQENT